MKIRTTSRVPATWLCLALILAISASALAEDQPAKKDPPSAETPPWSEPTAPPVGQSGSDALPPPVVRVRKGKPRTTARDGAPRIKDVPSRTPVPSTPSTRTPPATNAAGSGGATTTRTGLAPIQANRNTIQGIGKTHNLRYGDGEDLALQIDVQYELWGQANREVHVGIWFARADNGTYLTSTMQEFADPKGHVTVQTRSGRVRANHARFAAKLMIPYRAFPVKAGAEEYDVEARVQVSRREGTGKITVLCLGETTFRVYGDSESKAQDEDGAFPPPAADDLGPIDLSGEIMDASPDMGRPVDLPPRK